MPYSSETIYQIINTPLIVLIAMKMLAKRHHRTSVISNPADKAYQSVAMIDQFNLSLDIDRWTWFDTILNEIVANHRNAKVTEYNIYQILGVNLVGAVRVAKETPRVNDEQIRESDHHMADDHLNPDVFGVAVHRDANSE